MDPLNHVIDFLKQKDELDVASSLLNTFKKYTNLPEQYDELGRLFFEIKDFQNSIDCVLKILEKCNTSEQEYSCYMNLAKLYNYTNEPQKSLEYVSKNLLINPRNHGLKLEKCLSLYFMGHYKESKILLEELLNDPELPSEMIDRCKFNMGVHLLSEGKFKEGLIHFIDIGHSLDIWKKIQNVPFSLWKGEIIENKTIAIIAEGGIGDEIINIRFARNIENMGMNPVFVTTRNDVYNLLLKNNFKVAKSIFELPMDSLYIQLMYLPITLNLDKNDLWNEPYLKANKNYVDKWKNILPEGKKIAIRWKGNPKYEHDLHRELPLEKLNEHLNFSRTDVTFVSVQKDNFDGLEKYPNVLNVADHLETLDDLLACLSLMDYTITSCTSVAHIAAAAGLPLTVCTPIVSYYIWQGDAKWYGDNCRVLKQKNCKDWSHLKELEEHIKNL